jgi:hypothetical protein
VQTKKYDRTHRRHNVKSILLLRYSRRSPLVAMESVDQVELCSYNHSELAMPPLCRNKQFHMSRAPFLVIAPSSREGAKAA